MLTKLRMKCLPFPSISSSSVPKTTPLRLVSNSNPTISKIRFPISIKPTIVSSSNSLSTFSIHTRCLQAKAFSSPSSFAHSGEIHVIVGPMFAGKTTNLLRRIQTETDHDAYNQLDVIGIDEAQFFEDLYEFCQEAADHDGKTLIVSGLDGDYLRRSFGSVLHIIPLADSVTKLSARCELCGKRAFFTLRKTEETQTELIGGGDIYMPVCRQHYVSGQVAMETARTVLESQMVQCGSCI